MNTLYNNNPDAVHSHLQGLVDMYDNLKESEKSCVIQVVTSVAGAHPEVTRHRGSTTVDSRYLEVVGTIFYKFKLPEVQINLHFG